MQSEKDKSILKILKEAENPVSTREIALKTNLAWHTANNHLLRLELAGTVEELRLSRISFWRIKK